MTQDELEKMAKETAAFGVHPSGEYIYSFYTEQLQAFAKLVAQHEREAIAQMIEDAPPLMEFAQNDQGGCLMCGFTPKLAAQTIRARGQA
jgi:hypothetical protein